jgi:hypothetical protein
MAWTVTEVTWVSSDPAAYTAAEQNTFQACLDARVARLEPKCTQDLAVFCERWFSQGNRFFVLNDGAKRIWFLFMRRTGQWRFMFSFNAQAASDLADVRTQIVERLMRVRQNVAAKMYWYPDNDTTGEATAFSAIQSLIDAHADAGGKTVVKERLTTRDFYSLEAAP